MRLTQYLWSEHGLTYMLEVSCQEILPIVKLLQVVTRKQCVQVVQSTDARARLKDDIPTKILLRPKEAKNDPSLTGVDLNSVGSATCQARVA
jgi:hypothetical protein